MRRPFLAPECLQVSSIDCGVAAVFTLLSGHGVRVSYERLRELCQTGVDGTSVDSLEDLCNSLGVDVVQHVVPVDLAASAMEGRFPLIAIVNRTRGVPHFVTVWRRVGPYLQVMDPAGGRRWVRREAFETELYDHPFRLPPGDFQEWMAESSFCEALVRRARALLPRETVEALTAGALAGRDPAELVAVDAALRLVAKTARATGGQRPSWNRQLFERAFEEARTSGSLAKELGAITVEGQGEGQLVCTSGAVLLARPLADGRRATASGDAQEATRTLPSVDGEGPPSTEAEPIHEPRFFGEIHRLLGPKARLLAYALLAGVFTLSLASTIELLIYRAAIDAPHLLTTFGARSGAAIALAALVLLLLALEAGVAYGGTSLGRHLELELRMQTLCALPRVDDHFVTSRPTTDLAYRAHNLVTASQLPTSLLSAARAVGTLFVTLAAIAWLDLWYLPPVLIGGGLLLLTFACTRSRLRELDTRNQVHASRLLTFFLDALRGSRPVRLHGYQDSFRTEQRRELGLWRRTGDSLVGTQATLEATNGLLGTALLVGVFWVFLRTGDNPRVFVLLAFWAFRIPPTIRTLVTVAQGYPVQRLALTRLLEVTRYAALSAEEESPDDLKAEPAAAAVRRGVSVSFRDVTLVANQHDILRHVSLELSPGEHVAIVGRSGSGKSSLVSLLLGFHRPSQGELHVDGAALDDARRRALLATAVWVDPAVHLWNTTIRDNVDYAANGLPRRPFLETAEVSDLLGVLDQMDRGLETPVGPEGNLVSGGEGQRIELARGLLRSQVRLVILDEAFRGLDRPARERLTRNARRAWQDATLLSVSHDIRTALEFPRVLVVERGEIAEDGRPAELAARPSRFRQLLEAETRALEELWGDQAWRHLEVSGGGIRDARGDA